MITLSPEEEAMVLEATDRLKERYRGQLNMETIEGLVTDSIKDLGSSAKTTTWVPILAERMTNDRIRALLRLETTEELDPAVLFLCVHNAGRSQMAAGFMRKLSDGEVDVFSAGSEPADSVNQVVVEAMAEKGIDISAETPQPWADDVVRAADVVITMGCGDACPVYSGKRYLDWELEDPAGKPLEEVRVIRDKIEIRVQGLLQELDG